MLNSMTIPFNSRARLLPLLFFLLILLFVPTHAMAWGVGVHLTLGSSLLGRLDILPVAMQTLLSAHPFDFLYGCIAADITLGKKFTHYLDHCHNWRIGRKILAKAETPQLEACAYGYLAHLAADTVAHSYFVPFKMVQSFNTVVLKHAYWELRAETGTEDKIWALARDIGQNDYRKHDQLLSSVLSDTIFSFRTNKRLFNSMVLVSRLQQWNKLLQTVSETSKWEIDQSERQELMDLASDATSGILGDEESPYWKADPTGDRALNAADMIRKNLNTLWLDGKLHEQEAGVILDDLRHYFRRGITNPDEMLHLQSAF